MGSPTHLGLRYTLRFDVARDRAEINKYAVERGDEECEEEDGSFKREENGRIIKIQFPPSPRDKTTSLRT